MNTICKFSLVFLGLLVLIFSGCEKDEQLDPEKETQSTEQDVSPCDGMLEFDYQTFSSAPSDSLVVDSLVLDGSCLTVHFRATGCDGSTWDVRLIDSGSSLDSDPSIRGIRLLLSNSETCQTEVSYSKSFDLTPLGSEAEGSGTILNMYQTSLSIYYVH